MIHKHAAMHQIDVGEARRRPLALRDWGSGTKGLLLLFGSRVVPCAAIVPLSHIRQDNLMSTSLLRGSGAGMYGDASKFIESKRDW